MGPIAYALLFSLVAGLAVAEKSDYCLSEIVKSDERIRSHGYPAEAHEVVTEDGYVLTLFRIPYSHKLKNQNEKRQPVLLQHGLFSNSDCFLCSGPDNSLAYLLADAGYDVWLGNARGNIYSRENNLISLNSHKFWHFDWHEIGTIDIPAMIDYILDETDFDKLHYAGHSQGTTVYFVMLSVRPEYNAKIKSGHVLAPCAYFEHGQSFIFNLLGPLVGTPGGIWNQLLVDTELIPHNNLVNRVVDNGCHLSDTICNNAFIMFANGGYENANAVSGNESLSSRGIQVLKPLSSLPELHERPDRDPSGWLLQQPGHPLPAAVPVARVPPVRLGHQEEQRAVRPGSASGLRSQPDHSAHSLVLQQQRCPVRTRGRQHPGRGLPPPGGGLPCARAELQPFGLYHCQEHEGAGQRSDH